MVGLLLLCLMMAACNTHGQNDPSQTTGCTTHTYGEWQTVTEATCYDQGMDERVCTTCGKIEHRVLSAKGHSMGFWMTVTPASCMENGEEARTCERCEHRETRAIAAHGHSYNNWTMSEGSCTESSIRSRLCVYCEEMQFEMYPPIGHIYSTWITERPAGCTEDGQDMRFCTQCGVKEYRYPAALDHEYGGIRCDRCAKYFVETAGHSLRMLTPDFGIQFDYSYITRENDEDIYHIVYTVTGASLDLMTHDTAPQGCFILYNEDYTSYWYANRVFMCRTGTEMTETVEIRVPTGTRITAMEFKKDAYIAPGIIPPEGDLFWDVYK